MPHEVSKLTRQAALLLYITDNKIGSGTDAYHQHQRCRFKLKWTMTNLQRRKGTPPSAKEGEVSAERRATDVKNVRFQRRIPRTSGLDGDVSAPIDRKREDVGARRQGARSLDGVKGVLA